MTIEAHRYVFLPMYEVYQVYLCGESPIDDRVWLVGTGRLNRYTKDVISHGSGPRRRRCAITATRHRSRSRTKVAKPIQIKHNQTNPWYQFI
jgi:hypothetical protein